MSHPLTVEPNFIEASAGTGKTFRIMQMLETIMKEDQKNGVSYNRLLRCIILTFTEKAAGELKARLKKKILELYQEGKNPEYYTYLRDLDQVPIATIHGFCNLILNEYPIETGTIGKAKLTNLEDIVSAELYLLKRKSFGIQDEVLLANLVEASNFFKEEKLIRKSAMKLISDTKDYFIPSNKFELELPHLTSESIISTAIAESFKHWIVFQIVDSSKKILSTSKYITYDQMILKLRSSVLSNPNLLNSLQERFEVCLLDEFQDTDKNQYEIFKTIFVKAESAEWNLYCIGDPKQSIYSFRGADIGIYLKAKSELNQNSTKQNPAENQLQTNFRSAKEMVEGYNLIFKAEGSGGRSHFFPISEPGFDSSHYTYSNVNVPDANSIKYALPSEEKAIHVIEFDGSYPNIDLVRETWETFITTEILNLIQLEKPFTYLYREGSESEIQRKKIRLNEVAILCESNKAAIDIETLLSKAGIPCSIYKRKGIYQSIEAEQIVNVLECIGDPHSPQSYRKLLYSELFGIRASDLGKFDEYTIESYEKRLIDHWVKLCDQKKFAECFRSILDETFLFWNFGLTKLQWERKRTNYKQIFQSLLEFQLTGNYALVEIIEELKKWKSDKTSEEEQPMYDKETEDDAVQIMTIHNSKGLEWPVVFLYSFGSRSSSLDDYEYPYLSEADGNPERKWMMKFFEEKISEGTPRKTQEQIKQLNKQNELANYLNERRRLLYVGITRPNVRLYLPFVRWGTTENAALYSFQNTSYGAILYPDLKRIKESNSKPECFAYRIFSQNTSTPLYSINQHTKKDSSESSKIYLDFPSTEKRLVFQHSYSGLKSHSYFPKTDSDSYTKDDEDSKAGEGDPSTKSENQIPSNSIVGNFFHKILENVEYPIFLMKENEILEHPSWKESYKQAIREYPIYNYKGTIPLEKAVLQIIMKAMNAEFFISNSSLTLSRLTKEKRSNELKFQFYLDKLLSPFVKNYPLLRRNIEQYLKGAIDLVFENDGLYYIADFKTDNLPNGDYSSKALDQTLIEKGYSIQKEIYAFVLFEYLSSLFGETIALEKFGGVFYFFLRGMDYGKGIYSDLGEKEKWTADRFQKIQANIADLVLKTSVRWSNEF